MKKSKNSYFKKLLFTINAVYKGDYYKFSRRMSPKYGRKNKPYFFNIKNINRVLYTKNSSFLPSGFLSISKSESTQTKNDLIYLSISNDTLSNKYNLIILLKSIFFISLSRVKKFWFYRYYFAPFFDVLRFIMSTHLNVYFPQFSASLSANYYSFQFQRILNSKSQILLIKLVYNTNSHLLRVSFLKIYKSLKLFSVANISWTLAGRVSGRPLCNRVRKGNFLYKPSTKYPYNPMGHIFSYEKVSYTSKHGSSSIGVLLNYTILF